MLFVDLPAATEIAQRPVPVIERFLDRRGSGWNMPSMSTVIVAAMDREVDLDLEHMQLSLPTEGRRVVPIRHGGRLKFSAAPGTFADESEEDE